MANQLVKINGRNLYDGLGTGANFETLSISGRGLAPTRDRQLQFPGDVGARDYGSLPDVRRITISGILHANTINQFTSALDELKMVCRSRLKVDEILYGEVEAQTLWFADESVIQTGNIAAASGGGYISATTADLDAGSSDNDHYNGMQIEITGGAGAGQVQDIVDYLGAFKVVTIGKAWSTNPDGTSTFWILDNRYHLINYSGTMNEERLTRQWFAHGFANITLPFKAVYPFAVSDVKNTEFTPNSTNGYFKSINTGTAPTYPVYRIKGEANTPTIVEATHSLVWNANDNNATNILGESVSATVSAAGFYGQTGKLNQAIAFDTNQDKTQGDVVSITNVGVRPSLGIGVGANYNQGTVGFWAKKSGDWFDPAVELDYQYILKSYSSSDGLILFVNKAWGSNRIVLQVNDQVCEVSPTLTAGDWFYFIFRWDTRRTGFSTSSASSYILGEIYNTAGALVANASVTTDPSEADGVNSPITLGNDGAGSSFFDGLIDDLAIWDRPLTDTERNTLVNSGTGVRADTVASSELVYYSDFDQTVGTVFDDETIASSNMDTAQVSVTSDTAATVGGYGDKIFSASDRFVLYDETGYKVQSTVATSADTSITYATLTDADKVGVYGTLNGAQWYQNATNTVANPTTKIYSVSAWVKTTYTTGDQVVIYKQSATAGVAVEINTSGFLVGYLRESSTNYIATANTLAVNDGKWHHIAYTSDGTTQQLYVDGVECGYSAQASVAGVTSASNTGTPNIGRNGNTGSGLLNGSIRDVAVWVNTGLTSANVLTLATNPVSGVGSVAGAAVHWKMVDAASATTLDDAIGTSDLAFNGGTTTNYGTHSRTQLAYISRNLIADGGMENGGIGGRVSVLDTCVYSKTTAAIKDAQSFHVHCPTGFGTDRWNSSSMSVADGEDYVARMWVKRTGTSPLQMFGQTFEGGTLRTELQLNVSGAIGTDWTFIESSYQIDKGGGSVGDNFKIQSYGANTAADNFDIDDIKLLPNLVDNGGCEGAVQGLDPYYPLNWGLQGSPAAGTIAVNATAAHSGSLGVQFIACAPSTGVKFWGASLIVGQTYEYSLWVNISSGSIRLQDGWLNFPLSYVGTTSGWERKSFFFTASAVGFAPIIDCQLTTSGYIDDVSLVHRPDLSASFNNMTNGYRFEPTRLTRGYKTGYNELGYFVGQVFNLDEFCVRAVFRPQFPSTTGSDEYLVGAYEVLNSRLSIFYQSSSDKFVFESYDSTSGTRTSTTPAMNFNQDEELELGWAFDSSGSRVYVNGSGAGATNNGVGTPLTNDMSVVAFGSDYYSNHTGNYIIDDLEILAKSQPAEWFAEKHAKRNAAKFENLKAVYASTLDAGDILTLDSNTTKVIARAKLWDASASTDTDALTNMTINQSKMPILSPTKSMLYFPNSIPSGVEIYYRNNFQ